MRDCPGAGTIHRLDLPPALLGMIDGLSLDALERLARVHFSRSALRRRRLDRRDQQIRDVARDLIASGAPLAGKGLTRAVKAALDRSLAES